MNEEQKKDLLKLVESFLIREPQKLTDKQLAKALLEYFQQEQKHRSDNPVWQVMKNELDKRNYWRAAPRGNPRKGFREGWGKTQKTQKSREEW